MTGRILAIASAVLRETARLASARAAAVLTALSVPAATVASDSSLWLSRTIAAEGLRLALPIASVVIGAFALRPAIRRGWATLPSRRSEWFIGAALAGLTLAGAGVVLLLAGAALANLWAGDGARLVQPLGPQRVFGANGEVSVAENAHLVAREGEDGLAFLFERPPQSEVRGEIEYLPFLSGDAPPNREVPFDVYVWGDGPTVDESVPGVRDRLRDFGTKARVLALSSRRAEFTAEMPESGPVWVEIVPTDKALNIGVRPGGVVLQADRVSALPSLLLLSALALAAAALCMAATMLVRSLASGPTAALAGMLVLAALTLLPGLTPASRMAADRRAAVEGQKDESTITDALSNLPELIPTAPFDAYLRGRTVQADMLADATWRALAALALLPLGALLFTRRQIVK